MIFKRNALNDLPTKTFQDIIDYQIGDNVKQIQKKYYFLINKNINMYKIC